MFLISSTGIFNCDDYNVTSFDAEAGTITSICEKCWSGTEDPTPGVEKEKVSFSVREFKRRQQRDEISQYMSASNDTDDGPFTIGNFIQSQKND